MNKQTEPYNPKLLNQLYFQRLGTKKVIADFNGETITSDAGALLLREIDSANNFIENSASCLIDYRNQGYVEHSVKELVAQRTIGICLGYENLLVFYSWRQDGGSC